LSLTTAEQHNYIHPTAIIHKDTLIGKGNFVGPYCVIAPNVKIGDNNRFEALCTIGTPAEHKDYFRSPAGAIRIGDNNIFREFVSVQGGTTFVTSIGNNCSFLTSSYVAHDCFIEDGVTLSGHSKMGGKVYVSEGANLGLGCDVHQFALIGAYSMLGMGCGVTKTSRILPGRVYVGIPAREMKLNQMALDRHGIDSNKLKKLEEVFLRRLSLPAIERLCRAKES
jgi:UDP-N-acetylglucosamine acyltransferase